MKHRNQGRSARVSWNRRGSHESETTRHLVASGKLVVCQITFFIFSRGGARFRIWLLRTGPGSRVRSATASGPLHRAAVCQTRVCMGGWLLAACGSAMGVAHGVLGAASISTGVLGCTALLPQPLVRRVLAIGNCARMALGLLPFPRQVAGQLELAGFVSS